jgi:hypothetical protein
VDHALIGHASYIRSCSPPTGYMPLVIHTIQLAEVAQALITAVTPDAAPHHAIARGSHLAEGPMDAPALPVDEVEPAAPLSPPSGTKTPEAGQQGRMTCP